MRTLLAIALLLGAGLACAQDFTCVTSGSTVTCFGVVNGKAVTCTTIYSGGSSTTFCS